MIYIVGSAGSGKTTTVKWIMNKLDIRLFDDPCPCVSDLTRNIYFLGRYKAFHGISTTKKFLDDGTDRLVPCVETLQLKQILVRLCQNSNILICDGISRLAFNTKMITLAQTIGYSIMIYELSIDEKNKKSTIDNQR